MKKTKGSFEKRVGKARKALSLVLISTFISFHLSLADNQPIPVTSELIPEKPITQESVPDPNPVLPSTTETLLAEPSFSEMIQNTMKKLEPEAVSSPAMAVMVAAVETENTLLHDIEILARKRIGGTQQSSSERYNNHFDWDNNGIITAVEQMTLRNLADVDQETFERMIDKIIEEAVLYIGMGSALPIDADIMNAFDRNKDVRIDEEDIKLLKQELYALKGQEAPFVVISTPLVEAGETSALISVPVEDVPRNGKVYVMLWDEFANYLWTQHEMTPDENGLYQLNIEGLTQGGLFRYYMMVVDGQGEEESRSDDFIFQTLAPLEAQAEFEEPDDCEGVSEPIILGGGEATMDAEGRAKFKVYGTGTEVVGLEQSVRIVIIDPDSGNIIKLGGLQPDRDGGFYFFEALLDPAKEYQYYFEVAKGPFPIPALYRTGIATLPVAEPIDSPA